MKALRGSISTHFASLLATIESNPIALMVLQYLTAASRAAIIYLVSVIWTLAQSLVWMVTAEGLDWIQSQSFGPLILEWDSFLFGAVFLTVDIHPDSMEYHHAKHCCGWSSSSSSVKSHSRTNSRSSSLSTNNTGRRVTFDEQVMVLGRSGAVGARGGGVTPILINSSNSYYHSSSASFSSFCQDPHAPIITESPTRSTFGPAPAFSPLQEAEYLQRNYGYGYQFIDSPSSSRSNSCRSSICSVSSTSSSESNNDREYAKPASSSTSTKSNSSKRLAALFHSSSRHTTAHSPPSSSSSSIDLSTQPSGTDKKSKNLVHRMLHPHQHKRELEHQHQLQLQLQQLQQQQQRPQQQMRQYPQPYHIPEFLDAMTTSSSVMDHEYQPSEHTRKTLKQRLGLKKKSLST
ncbi:hypothetical protein EC991_005452 [Linnemannia zychae]|nr:hypothetical protein EC991_005452 [Linnemannia zychae]